MKSWFEKYINLTSYCSKYLMYLSFRSSQCGGDSLMEILDATCHRRYQWRHCRHRWRHRHRLRATEDQFENPVAEGLTPIPVQSRKKINSKETFFYYVENRNPRLIKKLLCVRLLNRSDFEWCSKSKIWLVCFDFEYFQKTFFGPVFK